MTHFPADYHMHTPLCRHAVGQPVQYAQRAVALGLTEIGFSDHSPMWRDDFDDWRMRLDQLDEYVETVKHAQMDYPQLTVKLALEVDYLPGHEDWVKDLAARHPWDYFIGSVHYTHDAWAMDNPNKLDEWKKREPFEIWEEYLRRMRMAAESGLFDILGHLDLCKKFNIIPERDCTNLFLEVLRAAARRDTAIEINTAGWRKDCQEAYPSLKLLRLAAEERVALTFGSDAHATEEVGADFDRAVDLARSVGYTHWRRFTRRSREAVLL